jgi:hypothetical protein
MKNVLSELDQMIVNAESKEYFLSAPRNHLREFEAFLADPKNHTVGVAGFVLSLAEQQLVAVKKLVTKYGPNLRIGGGK